MGVSGNTVVYHWRQLYARLGVAHREELLARGRAGAAAR